MALQNQPSFIPQPFADSGDKNDISTSSTTNGLASWPEGFNTVNSMPLAAGGVAPSRLDFNGMFNVLSQFAMFAQQGGVFAWDEGQDYSASALISHNSTLYQCLAENGPNTSNGVQEPSATNTSYWIGVLTDACRASDEDIETGTSTTKFPNVAQLMSVAVIPSGFIGMWSGSTDTIPTGWALCDGENNTPDLRDRFIVGAGSTYAVGGTGGSTTTGATTLTTGQMPNHKHAFEGNFADNVSGYSAISTGTAGSSSYTTNSIGYSGSSNSHTHSQNLPPYYALAYIMKL